MNTDAVAKSYLTVGKIKKPRWSRKTVIRRGTGRQNRVKSGTLTVKLNQYFGRDRTDKLQF